MANSYLDSIERAREFVQAHLKDWENIDAKVLDIVANAQKITSIPMDSGSIKELNNRIEENMELRKQLNVVVAEQAAKISALQNQITKLNTVQKQSTSAMTDEERQLKILANSEKRLIDVKSEHWKQIEANRQAANQEAQGIRNRLTTYGQYSQQLIQMTRTYKDLAMQKARLNNLTVDEVKRMDALEKQITKLRTQLVSVDHSVGQFGRSVGSYGKQFDSLGFSIAQVTREFPAFAYGAQIGFAALSNNIPILVDEINKMRRQVAALRAEGKATASVMSRLGSSIFGFQTALSVAVTLLTLYGADLIEAAFGATEAEKAQKALNEAITEGEADSRAASHEMRAYIRVLQDASASEDARKGALKALKGEVTELKDVELGQRDAMQLVIDKTAPYIVAAQARAKADAFARLAAEAEAKLIQAKAKSLEDTSKWYDYVTSALTSFGNAGTFSYEMVTRAANRHSDEVKDQESILSTLTEAYDKYLTEALEAESKIADKTKGGTEAKRDRLKAMDEMNKMQRFTVAHYELMIGALEKEQKLVSKSSAEWSNFAKSIKEYQDAIRIIQDIQKYAREELAMTKEELEAFNKQVTASLEMRGIETGMERLAEITGQTLEELYNEMHGWYGKDYDAYVKFSEQKLLKKQWEAEQIKKLQKEIIEASIKLGSAIFEAEIEKIEQKIDANKDYYAQLLAGEELTQERRAALEAERDLKERQLMKEKRKRENEQFLYEQGIALARVIINTAVAVTAALPNLALAALMGILGGIEAATIIATAIPKFEKGTQNAPAGLAIVDEVRPEVHTDKRGRVKSYGSEKGANLRFLEQGDKIYKSREEFLSKVGPKELTNTIFAINMQHQGKPVSANGLNEALLRELMALRGDNSKVWGEVRKLASRPIFNNVKVEIPDNRPY